MCGICGIVRGDGRAVDPAVLGAMSDTLRHRGPDSAGEALLGEAGPAARRLAIIDLEGGDQPISGEDGRVVVVQNGEIYNHAELRTELEAQGHRFRTPHSDTEVLVHLYEQHGPRFAERLRGMFAVAVWDGPRRRLVPPRPRFGIKPLYYRDVPGELAFSSELKALRALPGLSRELDLDALEAFLAFNAIHGPRTIFREVRTLPPGHALVRGGAHAPAGPRPRAGGRPCGTGALRVRPAGSRARAARRAVGGAGRRAARAPARLRARAPRGRRARRRAALGRHRLLGARGAGGAGEPGARGDVLDRLRGAVVLGARACPHDRRAVRHPPPRVRGGAGRGRAAAHDRRRLRRALRGLLGAADVSRLRAGRASRQGRTVGRGRRRAVRGLRDLRRRRARAARWSRGPAAGSAGRAVAQRLGARAARLQAQALHARGSPAAARAPPRLEGDLLARRARGAAGAGAPGGGGPAGRVPRALGRDGGRRHAGAPAGRRPRDLPRRRPARQDGPDEHGALARAARAVPRPGR